MKLRKEKCVTSVDSDETYPFLGIFRFTNFLLGAQLDTGKPPRCFPVLNELWFLLKTCLDQGYRTDIMGDKTVLWGLRAMAYPNSRLVIKMRKSEFLVPLVTQPPVFLLSCAAWSQAPFNLALLKVQRHVITEHLETPLHCQGRGPYRCTDPIESAYNYELFSQRKPHSFIVWKCFCFCSNMVAEESKANNMLEVVTQVLTLPFVSLSKSHRCT